MKDNIQQPNSKALEAALASAKALVATLEAALAHPEPAGPALLDARQALSQYGIGRDGLLAAAERGEIELTRGPRNRLQVTRDEIERYLRSKPHRPRLRRAEPANDLEQWSAVAERELRAIGGHR